MRAAIIANSQSSSKLSLCEEADLALLRHALGVGPEEKLSLSFFLQEDATPAHPQLSCEKFDRIVLDLGSGPLLDDGVLTEVLKYGVDVTLFAPGTPADGVTYRGGFILGPSRAAAPSDFLEVFSRKVHVAPDAPALVSVNSSLTYAELERYSDLLAMKLIDGGVEPGARVGLFFNKSFELVASLLAVLKAGAAFVPLAPAYPMARHQGMVSDSGMQLVLCDASNRAKAAKLATAGACDCSVVDLADLPQHAQDQAAFTARSVSGESLAYIIFTSGSTGKPKGGMVPRRGLANLVQVLRGVSGPVAGDTVLQFASSSFDASIAELVLALSNGAALFMPDESMPLIGDVLIDVLAGQKITHAILPPAVLAGLEPGTGLHHLRELFLAGEAAAPETVRDWCASGRRVFNAYGPTECSVHATTHLCLGTEMETPPIGFPGTDTLAAILDGEGRRMPPGGEGTLYLGGKGVSLGYCGDEKLTADRFVQLQEFPDETFYNTGDRVRFEPTGELTFLGRTDLQVKIDGRRIDLGEIEAVLLAHGAVQACAIVATGLHAFYSGGTSPEHLAKALAEMLPHYMQPVIHQRPDLPLTANGKVDRQALKNELESSFTADDAAPVSAIDVSADAGIEQAVVSIWEEILGVRPEHAGTRFFDMPGASSLASVRYQSRHRAVFGKDISIRQFYENPTVAGCAAHARRDMPFDGQFEFDDQLETPGTTPLSFQQRGVWLLEQMTTGSLAYNAQAIMRIKGRLDRELLQAALDEVVARHEIFRTAFRMDASGEPCQIVFPMAPAFLTFADLTGQGEEALRALVDREVAKPFKLSQLPLVRWVLAEMGPGDHALLHIEHHLVHDGWSANLFLKEMLDIYDRLAGHQVEPLAPPPAQYRHYVAWQKSEAGRRRTEEGVRFWSRKLAGASFHPPILTDLPRPPRQDFKGQQLRFTLKADRLAQLDAFARKNGVSRYATMLAAFTVLLHQQSGQDDVLVGSAMANRRAKASEAMIGMWVNSTVIRSRTDKDMSFAAHLQRVQGEIADAQDYQDTAFEEVVRALDPKRTLSHNPIFQVGFSYHNSDQPLMHRHDFDLSVEAAYSNRSSKFDLEVVLVPEIDPDGSERELTVVWTYASSLFERARMETMWECYDELLARCIEAPETALANLPTLSARLRQQITLNWNPCSAEELEPYCLHTRFETHAERTPDAVAVTDLGGGALTYGELNAAANRLARHLRRFGARPERLVAIHMDRSVSMVVAMLAAVKAGAGYLPLDPTHPVERLRFILENAEPVAILTDGTVEEERFSANGLAIPLIDITETGFWQANPASNLSPSESGIGPEDRAYVIYTSGSTGRPKGVEVEHRQISSLFQATESKFAFGPTDVWTCFHSFAFDFSVWELWGALIHGGKVIVLPSDMARNTAEFLALLVRERVTVLNQTPAAFRALIEVQGETEAEKSHCVRQVILGGDIVDVSSLSPWLKRPENAGSVITNMYGITETTVHVTECDMSKELIEDVRPGSPVGRKLDHLKLYVVDRNGALCAPGVPGEILVGGAGVARGYLRNPDLTAERFVDNLIVPGERLYRSGDLARFRNNGSVEFLGRIDHQISLRGYRIEPGEIEAALVACGAAQAFVMKREERLVGYVAGAPDLDELRNGLKRHLPDYMIPSAILTLDTLPLTANGKIDRRALPDPDETDLDLEIYVAPKDETERRIAAVWSQLLRVSQVGRSANFFSLGGHSLLVIRAIGLLRQQGLSVSAADFLANPVLSDLALHCSTENKAEADCVGFVMSDAERAAVEKAVPGGRDNLQDAYPLGPFQEGALFHHLMTSETDPYTIWRGYRFRSRVEVDRYVEALQTVIDRHDALRTGFVWQQLVSPLQFVARHAPVELVELETVLDRESDPVVQLEKILGLETFRFDLSKPPLFKLYHARDVDGAHVVLNVFHHIIDDNTSLKQLDFEVAQVMRGKVAELPDPVPFRPYLLAMREQMETPEAAAYFGARLGHLTEPTVAFGCDVSVEALKMTHAHTVFLRDGSLALLRRAASAAGVSLAAFAHAAMTLLMMKGSGREEVTFGSVMTGRMNAGAGAERVLGPFINTLPFSHGRPDLAPRAFLNHVQGELNGLIRFENTSIPFIQQLSGIKAPKMLFNALLNYRHRDPMADGDQSGRVLPDVEELSCQERSNFPLSVDVDDAGGYVRIAVTASGGKQSSQIAAILVDICLNLARQVETGSDIPVSDIVSKAGQHCTAKDLSSAILMGAPLASPDRKAIHHHFEERSSQTPTSVALVDGDRCMTYRELDEASNQLARVLVRRGVGTDRIVMLAIPRSLELVTYILATLKAGGAYLPVDPEGGQARLEAICKDAAPQVIVCLDERTEFFAGETVASVSDLLEQSRGLPKERLAQAGEGASDSAAALVIYTSGSTGTPKGVVVEHRNLSAVVDAWHQGLNLGPQTTVLQMASAAFDVFTADVIRSLCFGGKLVLAGRESLLDPQELAALIRKERTNFADFVPATLDMLMQSRWGDEECFGHFETVVCGSDRWSAQSATRLRSLCGSDARLLHAYGLTEATIDSLVSVLPTGPEAIDRLSLGRPLPGMCAAILDERGDPVAKGEAGELYVGGAGVARGYLNRPELTAERFVELDLCGLGRMYRTGDRVRLTEDGDVEFLGRADNQVKVSGHRIEPGEVEAALLRAGAGTAAVVERSGCLVAFTDDAVSPEMLKTALLSDLPAYLVPSRILSLSRFPLTANGKIDREALDLPSSGDAEDPAFEAPRSDMEKLAASVWAEILGTARIGRNDRFFDIGGHSMPAVRVALRLTEILKRDIRAVELFRKPCLSEFASALEESNPDTLPDMEPADRSQPLELSPSQRQLWLATREGNANAAYNMPLFLHLTGELDAAALQTALNAVLKRHEPLRTLIAEDEGEPVQKILPPDTTLSLSVQDMTGADTDEIERLRELELARPIDLERDLPIRATLLKRSMSCHELLLTIHHIAADGWSIGELWRELASYYAQVRAGEVLDVREPSATYADYAAWQNRCLQSDAFAGQLEYWKERLGDAPPTSTPPPDQPRSGNRDYKGRALPVSFGKELTAGLNSVAKQCDTTVFTVLLAGLALVVGRFAGQSDLVLGIPNANRQKSETQNLIGFFVNTLALRVDLSEASGFDELVAQVRERFLEAQDNQHIPFEEIVRVLNPQRSASFSPLFQVMLAWEGDVEEPPAMPGLSVELLPHERRSAKFDMLLGLHGTADGIRGSLEYSTALFEDDTALRLLKVLERLLEQVRRTPGIALAEIDFLGDVDRSRILTSLSSGARVDYSGVPLWHRFENQARKTPNAPALEFSGDRLDYAGLLENAERIAWAMQQSGVEPGDRVAISLDRSFDMVAGVLATARVGAVCVPVDPAYPADRRAFILKDAEPRVWIAREGDTPGMPNAGQAVIHPETFEKSQKPSSVPAHESGPDDVCYILYTSGSTGWPKGVSQTHRMLCNLVSWQADTDRQKRPNPARVLQFASLNFDVAFQEIYTTLSGGGCLVLVEEDMRRDMEQLGKFLSEAGIDRAFLPFAVLQQLAGFEQPLGGACEIITAGEALVATEAVTSFARRCGGRVLCNQYGPTETHVVTEQVLDIADMADWPARPPIGRPLPNTRVYILGPDLELLPQGAIGEIVVAGECVAAGYWNNPALTLERFVDDPWGNDPGRKMYRTGDLGRFNREGAIEYVGRQDDQIKIRGFRVELGEVEASILDLPGVEEAAAIAQPTPRGDLELVAFVRGQVDFEDLKLALAKRLPEHMMPLRWQQLASFPITANGKIDRRALAKDVVESRPNDHEPPVGETEQRLAAIWEEILKVNGAGRRETFFSLGGHSLLAAKLIHHIRSVFAVQIGLSDIFQHPSLADLAAVVDARRATSPDAEDVVSIVADPDNRYCPFPLTDIQEAYWVGRSEGIGLGGVSAHAYDERRLTGLDPERFETALNRLIARHDMLRVVFLEDGTQKILQDVPHYTVKIVDVSGLSSEDRETRLAETRERMSHQLHDATRWPLYEFVLTRVDETVFHLHLSMDSLIVDAASGDIFMHELVTLYRDPEARLPPIDVTFRDYVLAERAMRDAPQYKTSLDYWLERLDTLASGPDLALLRQPDSITKPRFTRREHVVDAEEWSALKKQAASRGLSPSGMLLAVFSEVLARYAKTSRFTLSLPLFNRQPLHPHINRVIGDFTSVVLCEVEVEDDLPFAEFARQVQTRLWRDMDHAKVSGIRITRELAKARQSQQAPFPVVFNSTLVAGDVDPVELGFSRELKAERVHTITQTPQVWIDHTIVEIDGCLAFNWDSIDDLFPDGLMEAMFAEYLELLERLSADGGWNEFLADRKPLPSEPASWQQEELGLLHDRFDRQAALTPDLPAILSGQRSMSYAQVAAEARSLAGRLQQEGLEPGELVAIAMSPGWEQAVAALAILFAGGAYLPMDPSLPSERIRSIVDQTGAKIALVQPKVQIGLPGGMRIIEVQPDPEESAFAFQRVERVETDVAYVIFTSGSTGVPKGVVIDHGGAVNTILDINDRIGLISSDRVFALSALSFDLSVYDIFGTLTAGAAVVYPEADLARDPVHWLNLADRFGVTVWNSVPALLSMFVETAEAERRSIPESLRLAMLSGDWIPLTLPDRFRTLCPSAKVLSLGGATEASIWSISHPVDELDPSWSSIPYGTALRGQGMHVLDSALRERPAWATGEIYISGRGLALGYWKDRERTARSFILHPVTGQRLYRTGDLGRYRPDGIIEFLGRADTQVKVQGYRIELGEIEKALERYPGVRAAAARVWGDNMSAKTLAGYVVMNAGSFDEIAFKTFLETILPSYEVPSSIIQLENMPLSSNGKVDRARLPEIRETTPAPALSCEYGSAEEERIGEIVSGIMGGRPVKPSDNLLAFGATSIDIVRMSNAIASELGVRPPLARFMRAPTLLTLLEIWREARPMPEAAAGEAVSRGGPIEDHAARSSFKEEERGLRKLPSSARRVALPIAPDTADYRRLRSVREYRREPVPLAALAGLLGALARNGDDAAPRYRYASAGGLYPVQTYLYVKDGLVEGCAEGAYYFDPKAGALVTLSGQERLTADAYDFFVNRPTFEGAAFSIFLVADLAAIEPLYGEQSEAFCLIETGEMAQELAHAAAENRLGLCGIGNAEPELVVRLFGLGSAHRPMYSLLGGLREDLEDDAVDPSLTSVEEYEEFDL